MHRYIQGDSHHRGNLGWRHINHDDDEASLYPGDTHITEEISDEDPSDIYYQFQVEEDSDTHITEEISDDDPSDIYYQFQVEDDSTQ
jgi:uncharacterized protein (DUF2249 family)